MNRSQLRALVIDHTGRSDKTDLINSMLDEAVRKISSEHLWNDLVTELSTTLVAGTESITLDPTLRRLFEFRIMDGLSSYQLEIRPKTWVVTQWSDPAALAVGKPRYGYLQGTVLYLVPPPDLAYEVRYSYYRHHPRLTSDTSSVLIPQADEAVVAYATYRTFKSLQQHEDANLWFADYQELLMDAKRMDRSSAVRHVAMPRGTGEPVPGDFWLDPFVKRTP